MLNESGGSLIMIKQLAGYIRQYKKNAILAPIFVIIQVVMEVIIPIFMSNLIDYGVDKGNIDYVIKSGVYLLFCAVISLFAGYLAGKNAAKASAGFATNLRQTMYYNVQNFSFSNIDKFSTPSIITRLTTDVTNVQNAFQMVIFAAVRAPIMLIFSLCISCRIDFGLFMVFTAFIPIMSVALLFIVKNAHPLFKKVFKTYDDLNKVVEENVSAVRVVKSFNRQEFENHKFYGISKKIYDNFSKAEKIISFNMPVMQFSMYGCILLLSWFGAKLIVACKNDPVSGLSTGELMSFISYTMQILMSLMILSLVLVMIIMASSSAKRIIEIINEESDLKDCEKPIKTLPDGSIRFENVGFSYVKDKNKLSIKDINFSLNSGETLGIIGGTGSGKSTLVQLIPRLYDATLGTVYVGGNDIRNYDMEVLRNSVSMVLQKNTLFSGTIKENLKWGNENATNEEIVNACRLSQADAFINDFSKKYDTYLEQGGSNISGGQKQRLCIARALLKNPKILILDDSTSSVDTKTEKLIHDALETKVSNMTKIIIAHRVSSVKDADKIMVMDNGMIVAMGSHGDLLKSCEIYKNIYTSQTQKKGENNDG